MKRLFDILFSSLLLLVLAVPLLALALLVRLRLGSPVFFRQQRVGRGGRVFSLLKLRTMKEMCTDSGVPLSDEIRMTALGRFLRTSSLDELPELWNILCGDMSLVGPRPLLVDYLPLYNERQARRHEVRPGLTGLAQVNGRNALSWEERFELDVTYVETHTLWLDLCILLRTVGTVLSHKGVDGADGKPMPPFTGSKK